jgi:hypothetical protein
MVFSCEVLHTLVIRTDEPVLYYSKPEFVRQLLTQNTRSKVLDGES